jgi:hypothetical protein
VKILTGDCANVLGPAPRLVLAMTQFRQGKANTARATLSQAIAGFDWSNPGSDENDFWLYHALRREAETMIAINPPPSSASK